jgi:hypothetical protein
VELLHHLPQRGPWKRVKALTAQDTEHTPRIRSACTESGHFARVRDRLTLCEQTIDRIARSNSTAARTWPMDMDAPDTFAGVLHNVPHHSNAQRQTPAALQDPPTPQSASTAQWASV